VRLRPVVTRDVRGDTSLAVLYGESPRCLWPLLHRGGWPRPRTDRLCANACWRVNRCGECGCWRSTLLCLAGLQIGAEVVVAEDDTNLGRADAMWTYEISFDGGAREVRGRRVAGAGVAIFGARGADGVRQRVAGCAIALPQQHSAQYAEAYGCRAALLWLAARRDRVRCARIIGDNLAVVRYCAGQGGLRRPALQALLEAPLASAYASGWQVEWVAVRRRLNAAADALATAGVMWAANVAEAGGCSVLTRWDDG